MKYSPLWTYNIACEWRNMRTNSQTFVLSSSKYYQTSYQCKNSHELRFQLKCIVEKCVFLIKAILVVRVMTDFQVPATLRTLVRQRASLHTGARRRHLSAHSFAAGGHLYRELPWHERGGHPVRLRRGPTQPHPKVTSNRLNSWLVQCSHLSKIE